MIKLKELITESIPKRGDFMEREYKKKYFYFPIKRVNRKDQWIDYYDENVKIMIRVDLWNIKPGGIWNGRKVWK